MILVSPGIIGQVAWLILVDFSYSSVALPSPYG